MNTVEIRKPEWMKTRDYRVAHRKLNPDERWWTIVDGLARPGPQHFEAVSFIPAADFRFAGFDIDPVAPFIVHEFRVGGELVPMAYPFSAAHMMPKPGKRTSMLIPAETSIMVQLRNDQREAVPFTVRILEPRDIR